MKKITLLLALISVPALAQNAPSGSPRVQGTPDGYGDPVQVTLVASDGSTAPSDVTALCVYNSTLPTPTNGATVNAQCNSKGELRIEVADSNSLTLTMLPSNADGSSTTANAKMGLAYVYNGSTVDRARGDTNGLVTSVGLASTYWYYTSGVSPILSNTTTAVTIKASCGASTRCYIDSCQISSTALGASVPIAIRDGAGGTVLWASRPPTAGWLTPILLKFSPPLRSTAATLLEIATPTADTSGTFDVNCQGHTGS